MLSTGLDRRRFASPAALAALVALALGAGPDARAQQGGMTPTPDSDRLLKLDPAQDYLNAHKNDTEPAGLLGGPIRIRVRQDGGGVFAALPARRDLDPVIFGPPGMPRHYAGTPVITGVPPALREEKPDGGLRTRVRTPFGDKHVVLPEGRLDVEAVDATATDAATTRDQVRMTASWRDEGGNTYEVVCCDRLITHGIEFPTFGGVATNLILNGFTGIGTPLMPSAFAYFAFWGMGTVKKNGEVLDAPRLVQGMLTEYVRTEGYALGFDEDVTPGRFQFRLLVAPVKPDPKAGVFEQSPVATGFTLPNGEELPFWHVMFETLDYSAGRV